MIRQGTQSPRALVLAPIGRDAGLRRLIGCRSSCAARWVLVHASLRPGTYLRIQISDTGCGMDAATLGKAIEPFFSTKPLGKVTGLDIDVMMTDQAMPGMTGVQLVEVVRNERPDLPVLLANGYADLPAGRLASLPRLSKPYQQSQLQADIEKLLDSA